MAKNDRKDSQEPELQEPQQEVNNVDAEVTAPSEVAEVSIEVQPVPTMPVENQQAVHAAIVSNPNAAVQPGRDVLPAHAGVVGEIESLAHQAELNGEHALASVLHQLLVKLGEVYQHIRAVEKNVAEHIKPNFSKVLALFKK